MWLDSYDGISGAIRDLVGTYFTVEGQSLDFAYITACILLIIAAKYIFSTLANIVKGVFGY